MRVVRVLGVVALFGFVALGGVGIWRITRAPMGPDRPNFVVLDIDSFSPEHLGAVRDGVPVTSTLDRLAQRGTRFSLAISQSGWTLPALSSVLTGRLPTPVEVHEGVIPWRSPGVHDLPEILSWYGYTSAAFWGDTLPGPMSERLSASFGTASVQVGALDAPPTDEVIRWLAAPPEGPFFLYVHEIDLHHPWAFLQPRYPFGDAAVPPRGRFYPEIYAGFVERVGEIQARALTLAHYQSSLHLYDRAVGRILEQLDHSGLTERTVVILLSDHGNDLFEHAVVDHGLLYDTTVRVPLVIVDPRRGGHVVDTLVQGVDVAPTVLDLAGIPPDAQMDGRSLVPLLGPGGDGEGYTERPAFSMSDACAASWRTREWKVLLRDRRPRADRSWLAAGAVDGVLVSLEAFARDHLPAGTPLPDCSTLDPTRLATTVKAASAETGPSPAEIVVELYDLVEDPRERRNLVAERPDQAAALLAPLLTTLVERSAALRGAPGTPLRAEQERKIREQGYWTFLGPGGDERAEATGEGR